MAGYQGQTEAIHEAAPQAQDMTSRRTRYKDYVDELREAKNRTQGPRAGQGGASVPHPEARLRLYQSSAIAV